MVAALDGIALCETVRSDLRERDSEVIRPVALLHASRPLRGEGAVVAGERLQHCPFGVSLCHVRWEPLIPLKCPNHRDKPAVHTGEWCGEVARRFTPWHGFNRSRMSDVQTVHTDGTQYRDALAVQRSDR